MTFTVLTLEPELGSETLAPASGSATPSGTGDVAPGFEADDPPGLLLERSWPPPCLLS